jgi:hypothetical protein
MRSSFGYLLALSMLASAACTKEKLVIQEVEKTTSWSAWPGLYGTNTIILGMGKDANSILLQSPAFLNIISPIRGSAPYRNFGYIGRAAVGFPQDVRLKLPVSADFIAYAEPRQDTIVTLVPPSQPVTSGYSAYINLRKLDPQATGIVVNGHSSGLAFGAISSHNYLLFGYQTTINDPNLRFVIAEVIRQPAGNLSVQARRVVVPLGLNLAAHRIQWIQAVDNYFLANCEDAGLYKIREDGSVTRVFGLNKATTCYQWQGKIYAPEFDNKVLFSTDNGETWQRYLGLPDVLNFATYQAVGDSLIGINQTILPQLFTLRWHGNSYSLRFLKNDGLGNGSVRGIEQLADTVYVGTTSGLFKQPISRFFETKR